MRTSSARAPARWTISTIPATALRQVEVLRDGASAQFGLPYSQFTRWGLSGGYYYARLHRRWGR